MFITLEGPEGAGKTTQLARIEALLQSYGYAVVKTREPGGDAIGEKVRELLLYGHPNPEAELLLFAAARAQNVSEVVRPALKSGKAVLCDRFTDSTIAYQGFGRGLSLEVISTVNTFATGGLTPDVTLLLDLPVAMGLARRRGDTAGENRLDKESLAFHEKVRAGYLWQAKQEPSRLKIIDATQTPEGIFTQIQEVLTPFLGERAKKRAE
jgi:dTMP kinase